MLPGRAVVPICCGLVFLQPLLRAHARLRQLDGPRSLRSCCQPTALQRPPRQMTDRKSDRGRDGGFVAHGAPKKTAAAWNPRPEDPSGVSRDQAGRPSKARGIGLVETAEHVAWTRAPSAGGRTCSAVLHVLEERALIESRTVPSSKSETRSVCSPKSGPPRRGTPPHKGA